MGGPRDVFIAKLNSDCSSLLFSSYLGGAAFEIGTGIAVDTFGCAYLTGYTQSTDYPLASPYDQTLGSTADAFVTKICNLNCCVGATGNVDCSVGDGVDIGDLTTLIDNLFISFEPLCCTGEANCDGAGGVDIGDLTVLIDNLFVSFASLPACQ